jgi:hypothetical protein
MRSSRTAPAAQKRVCLASSRIIPHHAIIHDRELCRIRILNVLLTFGSEVHALEERVAELEALLAINSLDGAVKHRSDHSLDATRFVGPESGIK